MTPLIDPDKARNATAEAYSTLRQHHGSEQYKACADWINALIAQHQAAMTQCGKDKLVDTQVRIKQLVAMRSALVDPGGAFTGYVFD